MIRIKRGFKVTAATFSAGVLASVVLSACANEPDDNTVAKYIPDSAQAFLSVAANPSVKQKASLLSMSQHLPDDVQADKADEVRDNLLQELFDSDNEGSIDYKNEIKPWLGNEAAIAALPPVDGTNVPIVVGAVQAKDKDKAIATLNTHKVDSTHYRYLKGYIFFVEPDQAKDHDADKALDAIEKVTKGDAKSLQSVKRYQDNIGSLHGEHIVLGWFDVPALTHLAVAEAKKNLDDSNSSVTSELDDLAALNPNYGLLGGLAGLGDSKNTNEALDKVQAKADAMGTYSFEVYVNANSVVFQGVAEKAASDNGKTTDGAILKSLPGDTLGAVDVADFGKLVQDGFNQLKSDGEFKDVDTQLPELGQLVNSLSGEGVAVVGGGAKVSYGVVANVGNAVDAKSAISKLAEKLKQFDMVTTNTPITDGVGFKISYGSEKTELYIGANNSRVAFASQSAEFKQLLSGNGDLGSTDQIGLAFGDTPHLTFGSFYVNLDAAIKAYQKSSTADIDSDTKKWLDALSVVGAQSWSDDGHDYSEFRLAFK